MLMPFLVSHSPKRCRVLVMGSLSSVENTGGRSCSWPRRPLQGVSLRGRSCTRQPLGTETWQVRTDDALDPTDLELGRLRSKWQDPDPMPRLTFGGVGEVLGDTGGQAARTATDRTHIAAIPGRILDDVDSRACLEPERHGGWHRPGV